MLLCLNLAVFDPVAVLLNLFMATDSTGNDFTHHPELLRLSLIGGIPRIGLMVFSLYAGLNLWKTTPGAVAVARKYLICLFFFSIFSLFLPPNGGGDGESIPWDLGDERPQHHDYHGLGRGLVPLSHPLETSEGNLSRRKRRCRQRIAASLIDPGPCVFSKAHTRPAMTDSSPRDWSASQPACQDRVSTGVCSDKNN